MTRTFESDANSSGLMASANDIRAYFEIEYADNIGDILERFSKKLREYIPDHVIHNKSQAQLDAMSNLLIESDSDDPNKIYSNKVRKIQLKVMELQLKEVRLMITRLVYAILRYTKSLETINQ